MSDMLLPVTKIQKFCTKDGPGVRTTIFLKGCMLRCEWCHNPETQSARPEIMYSSQICIGCGACERACEQGAHALNEYGHGWTAERCVGCGKCADVCPSGACERAQRMMMPEAILQEALRDRPFYGKTGGITLSGGEPMVHPEGCARLLSMARAEGIHTAMETCGWFDGEWIERIAPLTRLFLWDFKDSDSNRHKKYTGRDNQRILDNLRRLDQQETEIRLRCILVRGVNLNEAHLSAIAETYHSLRRCKGVDLLPYHAYGSSKSIQLGREGNARPEWIPTEEQMVKAREYLRGRGVAVE